MRKEWNLLLDLFFYFLLPILIWETSRSVVNDFAAIILSSLPKVLYSLYRLFALKEFTFTRIFLLFTILTGLSIDLFSGSALQILWNSAFYSFGLAFVYLASISSKTPLFLYFALDTLVQQGYDKALTGTMLFEKNTLNILRFLTFSNAVNHMIYACLVMRMVSQKGVDSYTAIMLADQLLDFLMSGISVIGFIFIYKYLNEVEPINKTKRRRKARSRPHYGYLQNYERNYIFLNMQR